jgi:hypothetical protein
MPYPRAEDRYMPNAHRIVDAVRRAVAYA